jgi:glycosyltransferase involved in cell wall biosynthesis
MINVLHIVQQLSSGGAGRALEALSTFSYRSNHQIVSLVSATPEARRRLAISGVHLLQEPSVGQLASCIDDADVVQIHFWNTPELYLFMSSQHICRLVLWSHVNGSTAPHILIPELASYCQALVHTCRTQESGDIIIKPASPDQFMLRRNFPGDLYPLVVGVFGTLHSSRMCSEALDVFAQANCPGSRLLVVGQGDLVDPWKHNVDELNLHQRVQFKGLATDVPGELAHMDVLLYLPRPDSFATSDLALQEALLAGVVPVVLAGSPVADLVEHNVDGLIATNLQQCVEHLQTLDTNRELLQRLRSAGQTRSKQNLNPNHCARAFEHLYERICTTPKQARRLQLDAGNSGSERFMASLGAAAKAFRLSAERLPGWEQADDQIAYSNPALVGAGAGGILHWRGAYPNDRWLRYWAGLVFATAGRSALAAAEFAAAAKAGVIGAAERLESCRHAA